MPKLTLQIVPVTQHDTHLGQDQSVPKTRRDLNHAMQPQPFVIHGQCCFDFGTCFCQSNTVFQCCTGITLQDGQRLFFRRQFFSIRPWFFFLGVPSGRRFWFVQTNHMIE